MSKTTSKKLTLDESFAKLNEVYENASDDLALICIASPTAEVLEQSDCSAKVDSKLLTLGTTTDTLTLLGALLGCLGDRMGWDELFSFVKFCKKKFQDSGVWDNSVASMKMRVRNK